MSKSSAVQKKMRERTGIQAHAAFGRAGGRPAAAAGRAPSPPHTPSVASVASVTSAASVGEEEEEVVAVDSEGPGATPAGVAGGGERDRERSERRAASFNTMSGSPAASKATRQEVDVVSNSQRCMMDTTTGRP